MSGKTLSQKVWDRHVVRSADGEPDLLFIDLHLVHEVTSPQAFDGLRMAGRTVRHPELTVATEDHNVPTVDIDQPIADPVSRIQIETLRSNCDEFGVRLYPMGDPGQGIVHVIGPEKGLTLPGMTVVCGDSPPRTPGAFGAQAVGLDASDHPGCDARPAGDRIRDVSGEHGHHQGKRGLGTDLEQRAAKRVTGRGVRHVDAAEGERQCNQDAPRHHEGQHERHTSHQVLVRAGALLFSRGGRGARHLRRPRAF